MKYLRRQNLNLGNILDDTVLQTASGNIELNPTQKVTIRGDLEVIGGAIPGVEVTNILYVTQDGDDANDGNGEGPNQAKRTIKSALAIAQQGTTIYVRSGTYEEDNPLRVPPKVSIIGDNLRNTIVRPLNGPQSFDIINIERTDNITTITTATPHGLGTEHRIRVKCSDDRVDETDVNILEIPAADQISFRQSGANIVSTAETGTIKWAPDLFLVNSGDYLNGMVFKGLAAPAYCVAIDSDAIVDTSPYVQNCSNINGPWLRNGTEWLPFQTEQPDLNSTMVVGPRPLLDDEIDPLQVDQYGIDVEGAGGGMLIDGDRYNSQSPIKSMVADAFTQVAQGAVGFHISNFGYMQLVSCFAVFCAKGFYTTRGGYLSISNSVCDFGEYGFLADGYYLDPYSTGVTNQDYYSSVGSVTVNTTGSGFSVAPSVSIDPPTTPGGVQATAVASIDPILGIINAITITDPGSGYDFQPNLTITPANGATATANLAKNQFIEVFELPNKPQVGSVMLIGDIDPLTGNEIGYYVSQVTNESFTFKYDEQKCRRDVGLILEAVLTDAIFNTNHSSTYAGLSYLRSYSSKVTSLQKAQTIAGLQEARNQALTYTANVTMQNRITAGFNNVINIINIGLPAVSTIVNNPTTPRTAGFYEAAQILLANKTFIQDEIEAWITLNYPTLSYDVATCRRDISYITDAVAYDLTYEGNTQTVNSALAYAAGNVIAGQVEETQAAYEYWKTIVGQIAKNISIVPSIGNTTVQNTSLPLGSPLNPNAPATTAGDLLQIIIDVIDHGTGYIPDPVTFPDYANGDPTLNIERTAILADTLTIQDDVIDYLNNTYGGSTKVYTFPPIQSVLVGTNIRFHNVSTISTGGTALEYVGSGVTYNALPFFGGEPNPARERVEINNGKCFTVSNDQVGNFRIGQFFTVNALTGEVSIDASDLNLSGLAAIGPFKRNGVPVGVQLREVSNNANLIASNGIQDVNTVPTQQAVANYVESRYLNKITTNDQTISGDNVTFTGDVGINGGDLYSTAASVNIFNRDDKNSITENGPTTVNAFLNASTIGIGSGTGTTTVNNDLAVLGSIISTGQTSVNLLNTVATTVNAFGSASTINMGDASGTATINNTTFSLPNANLVSIDGANLTVQTQDLGGTLTLFDTYVSTVNAFRSATSVNMGEATGTFTINSASTITDGDLEIKGGDLTTNKTTFNLLNVTPTTVNAFDAATTLNLAAGSGTTTVRNNLQVNLNSTLGLDETSSNVYWGVFTANIRDNVSASLDIKESTNSYIKIDTNNTTERTTFGSIAKVTFANTSDASSALTGSTIFAGGVGIAKKLYVGTDLNVGGNSTLGDDRNTDTHTVDGTLVVNVPDATSVAFQIKENTQTYLTADTTNGSESITIESTPKLLVKNTTDSTDKDTGAVIVEGGVGIEKNLTVGVDLKVDRDGTITGDLSVNGGDITTTATTFNLLNTNATTINFGGAGTLVNIGAVTGKTNVKNDLDVDGDVNIDGGDLTVSTSTFNFANANATTVNEFGVATAINVAGSAAAASTLTFGSGSNSGNTFKITAPSSGTINYTTDVTSGTVNAWQSVTGTINVGSSGNINLGTAAGATSTVTVGGAITGNTLKIASTAIGTANLTSDVTSGTVNVFTGSTGTVNVGGQGIVLNLGDTNANSILEVRGSSAGGTATVRTNSGVATADVFNTVVTTGNIFGAATAIAIGASTGTTNIKHNLDVDGNINFDGGNLTTNVTTFNIFNTTATTINFGGAATNINIGASTGNTTVNNNLVIVGDVEIKGGDITVDASTTNFNIANTNATTVNAFNAATSIVIGAVTGTTNIRNQLDVDGDINIDGGDVTVSTSIFNLANTNATTVNFGGAATTVNIGSAGSGGILTIKNDNVVLDGDLQIKGGDIITNQTTFNLFNTNATTINAFNAATSIIIGATTGTTNIRNQLDVDGDINIDGGDLTVSGSTFNFANTTATTVNAFGAATSLVIGAATGTTNIRNALDVDGDINIDGGDLTVSASIFNIANVNATTVNAFNSATSLVIGATSGTTNIRNNLDVDIDINIDGSNITTTSNTVNIANTNSTTVNFAGAATAINIGFASPTGLTTVRHDLKVDGDFAVDGALTLGSNVTVTGDLAVNGGDLTTTSATFNLVNANATTVNFAGAGTAIAIGAATGTTNIKNNLDVDGDINFDGGDITTSAVTVNLLASTATTVNAFGAATALNLGAATGTTIVQNNFEVDLNTVLNGNLTVDLNATVTGDLGINGGDLTTSATTFNLFNTNATTINFGGAGTAIEIGASTGTTNINNNLDVDLNINIDGGSLTVSTSTFNFANTNATTINFGGAGTAIAIGSATGTTTIKHNLDVDGDVNIDGGDLTVSTSTFNLANTTATTVNFAGAGTTISIGAATGTTTINNANTVVTGDLAVNGGDITTSVTGTANIFNTNTTTVNAFGAGTTINIGASGSAGILTIRNDNVVLDGDLQVKGGDITTNQTTFNLLNTTATTVNFAGAGTTVLIGAGTGTTEVNNNLQVDLDLDVRGGDITTNQTTFNLLNTTATTVNAFGAGTAVAIGAATGTTNIKNNVQVDLDVEIRGGDLTTNQTTFNVFNTNATTINAFGVATGINVGTGAAAASTFTFGPAITGNIVKIAGTSSGTININTDVTVGIVNVFNTVTGTINIGDSGTINLGNGNSATTSVDIGGAITGNQLKISGTTSGTVTVTSDVTSGSVDLFNNITTGTLNVAGAGASTINLGSTTSTVNIGKLTLTTDLEVQYGGTGQSSFTTNGVIYGQNTSGLAVTAASVPGSNATTSYGILTTDVSNVPVWTDTIDGGSY